MPERREEVRRKVGLDVAPIPAPDWRNQAAECGGFRCSLFIDPDREACNARKTWARTHRTPYRSLCAHPGDQAPLAALIESSAFVAGLALRFTPGKD